MKLNPPIWGVFFIFILVSKSITYLLLGLYFFCYTIPQYIPNLIYVYDRVTSQLLFLSVLNVISFLLIVYKKNLDSFFSNFQDKYHFYSYLGFVIISVLSLFAADNVVAGLVSLTKVFIFFTSYLIIIFLSRNQKINFLKTFLSFALIGIFIESVFINYLFYDSVVTNGNFLERGNNFKGLTANINISSFSIALKIPFLLYIIFMKKNKFLRILSFILLYSSFLTILLLLSRAAILAISFVLFSILLLLFFNFNKFYIKNISRILISIFLSFISYQLINDKNPTDLITDRFSTVTDPGSDDSVKERVNFYSTAVMSIKENPLLGIGVGNWKVISIKYSKDIIREYRVPYFVHNDFLQVMAEIGILGGLMFIFFVFYPLYKTARKVFHDKAFTLSFVVFLIFGVYVVDSMLNFPMDRVVTFIYLIFSIALFYQISSIQDYEK